MEYDEKIWLRAIGNVLAKADYEVIEGSVHLSYGTSDLYDPPVTEDLAVGFTVYSRDKMFKDLVLEEYGLLSNNGIT